MKNILDWNNSRWIMTGEKISEFKHISMKTIQNFDLFYIIKNMYINSLQYIILKDILIVCTGCKQLCSLVLATRPVASTIWPVVCKIPPVNLCLRSPETKMSCTLLVAHSLKMKHILCKERALWAVPGCFTPLWYLSMLSFSCYDISFIFFLNVYFWERERERDKAPAREGQREKETQNPKLAPGSELSPQSPM